MVEIPEFRKLINFGKTSYVISLPKNWIKRNRLKKGDIITVEKISNKLMLIPGTFKDKKRRLEIKIKVDGKSFREIRREIIAYYINGYNTISLYGETISKLSTQIKSKIVTLLMGIEIIEESANKLVLKDFIAPGQINVLELLRKIDMIIRELFNDAKEFLNVPRVSVENIYFRDDEVNRLYFFLRRVFNAYLRNELQQKFSPIQIVTLLQIAGTMEKISDEIKRIAKYLNKVNRKKELLKSGFKQIYEEVERFYLKIMKALFVHNKELAFEATGKKEQLITKANKLLEKLQNIHYAQSALEKLKNVILLTNDIGRAISFDIHLENE